MRTLILLSALLLTACTSAPPELPVDNGEWKPLSEYSHQ